MHRLLNFLDPRHRTAYRLGLQYRTHHTPTPTGHCDRGAYYYSLTTHVRRRRTPREARLYFPLVYTAPVPTTVLYRDPAGTDPGTGYRSRGPGTAVPVPVPVPVPARTALYARPGLRGPVQLNIILYIQYA